MAQTHVFLACHPLVLAHTPHRVKIRPATHFFGVACAGFVAQSVGGRFALRPITVAAKAARATHLHAEVLELLAHCVAPFNGARPRFVLGSVTTMPRNYVWQVAALFTCVVVKAALVVGCWHRGPRRR